ncbi:MAG: response regulator transcription factor [Bacteroidota bacterium]
MTLTILLADDHKMFTDGLRSLLQAQESLEVIGIAQNGHQVLHLIDEKEPDLLIMDLQMPGMDGIETCKLVKQQYPKVHILALSMHAEPHLIKRFLQAGADGYVLKDAGQEALIEAIQHLQQGKPYYSPAVMHKIMEYTSQPRSSKRGQLLSRRELEIVSLIGEQMTTSEIAHELHLSPLTIETHRKNILLKLGLRNTAGLMKYAAQMGWI